MSVTELMAELPGTTLITIVLLVMLTRSIFRGLFRYLSIRKHGWPPPHLDGDGEPVSQQTEDEP